MGASTQRSLGSGLQNRMPVFCLAQVAAAARVRSGQDLHASKKNRERSPTEQLLSMRWWERHSDGYYCKEHQKKLVPIPLLGIVPFASFRGQNLGCSVCHNWMFDLDTSDDQ